MIFGIRLLDNVVNVNRFNYVTEIVSSAGDGLDVYFQLIDASQFNAGYSPMGNRYIAPTNSLCSVTILNTDAAKQFTRIASQPFSSDWSIFKFSLLPSDPVEGTVSLRFSLREPAAQRTVTVTGALRLWTNDLGGC